MRCGGLGALCAPCVLKTRSSEEACLNEKKSVVEQENMWEEILKIQK